jgi:N-acetyl-gamma-glutamylphosphate reductase
MKVLILGGYGTFGGRLARLLADEERITLIVAGRSMARAEAFSRYCPRAPR